MTRAVLACMILLAGCSTVPLQVDLQAAGRRARSARSYPVDHALTLLRPLPPRVVVITPAPGEDPYARLLALLKTAPGGQQVTRDHVVRLIKITQGVPLNLPLSSYPGIVTPAQLAAIKSLGTGLTYTPGLRSWLLTNKSQLFAEIAYTRAAILIPTPQPIRVEISQDTMPALLALWGDWRALASQGPALLRPLLAWGDFAEPVVLAHGGSEGYDVGLSLWRKKHGGELHLITREVHHVQHARGLAEASAWPGDKSLVYVPAKVEGYRVRALDVIASRRFRAYRRLAGGDPDLEVLWTTSSIAVAQVGPVRAGWSEGETWGGLELSGEGSWWRAHVAAGWPYGEATAMIRTPWPYLGVEARGSIAALWDDYLQGDVRSTTEIFAGPPWLRISGGLTWAVAPTKVDHLQSSLKPVLIRRHVSMQVRLSCGFEAEALVSVSRLAVSVRWKTGYRGEGWSVHLLGDVLNELPRSGVQGTVGPLRVMVLADHQGGAFEGAVGFSWEW